MKRKMVLILMLTIAVTSFSACGNNIDNNEETQVTEAVDSTEALAQQTESAPEFATTSVAYEGDSKYFFGEIQCIQITDGDHEALAKAVDREFSKRIKEFNKTSEEFVKEADQVNEDQAEERIAYYSNNVYAEVIRADSNIFSVKLLTDVYTGGAHDSHFVEGLVFDSKTGELISWDDLGDAANQSMNYILNIINSSDDNAKDQLFDEYETNLKEAFEEPENNIAMWLDNRGLVVTLQEYVIAPYAAGLPSFTVPYSALKDFNQAYVPSDESFYSFKLSELGFNSQVDVDDNGELDNVSVVSSYGEDGSASAVLKVNYTSTQLISDKDAADLTFETGYYVHRVDGAYIFITLRGADPEFYTYLYKINGDTVRKIDFNDYSISEIEADKVVMEKTVDGLGTWLGTRVFAYDNTGFEINDKSYKLNNNPANNSKATGLTLKQDISYIAKSGDEEVKEQLQEGTVIYPIAIYDDNRIEFVTEDGKITGFLEYTPAKGSNLVDGVPEDEVFDNLSYAG